MFDFLKRSKQKMKPAVLANTTEHYIPSPDYGNQPIPLSVWRLGLRKPPQDFWGDHGRLYDQQILTTQGPLLFPLKVVPTAGLGGTSETFGQSYTLPVAGFAGRPAALTQTSAAMEWNQVQASTPGKQVTQ